MRAIVIAALLSACAAPPPKPEPTPAPDPLAALEARRAGTDGGTLEAEAAAARRAGASVAVARHPDEPPPQDDAPVAGPRAATPDPGFAIGEAAPNDLDRGEDAPSGPWIPMDAVERAIRDRSKSFKSCRDEQAPGATGRMDIRLTIDAAGRASSAKLEPSSPLSDAALADCAIRVLRTIGYPEPSGGSISFVYPLKF